ncbi:zinc-binding dehydrogenase [Streptomyces sp. cg40]|uniref:zinc-binding dehydrogenase n=1 Tax=Streptomyces sp. cg40 TaxID=3419764 RepID=UPI003D083FE3
MRGWRCRGSAASWGPAAERGIRVGLVQARADGAELAALAGLVESGRLDLRVARTFPFERVAEAHTMLAKGGFRGGVVLVADFASPPASPQEGR